MYTRYIAVGNYSTYKNGSIPTWSGEPTKMAKQTMRETALGRKARHRKASPKKKRS